MQRTRILSRTAAVALAIVALTACSSSSKKGDSTTITTGGGVTVPTAAGGTTVTVDLGDTAGTNAPETLTASAKSVKAGSITFTATNTGTIKHELIVLSTTTTGADLKPGADGEVSEANNVGEVGDVEVGKTGTAAITLKPGTYILACNIKDHYKLGMWTDLTVTP
jgi:Uncharacterized copper-binding protein